MPVFSDEAKELIADFSEDERAEMAFFSLVPVADTSPFTESFVCSISTIALLVAVEIVPF